MAYNILFIFYLLIGVRWVLDTIYYVGEKYADYALL